MIKLNEIYCGKFFGIASKITNNFAFFFPFYSYEISLTNDAKKSLECKYYVNLLQNLTKKREKSKTLSTATITRNFDGIFRPVKYSDQLHGEKRRYNVCRALCSPEINRMDHISDDGWNIFSVTSSRSETFMGNAL